MKESTICRERIMPGKYFNLMTRKFFVAYRQQAIFQSGLGVPEHKNDAFAWQARRKPER
jgi:hypothetical protein